MATKQTTDKPLRLGIFGVGTMAQLVHIPILRKVDGVKIVGINDLDSDKGERFAQKQNLKWFENPEELLEVNPDGVLILTPNNSHVPLALGALAAGVNVLVEKPLARSVAEAERMIAAAEKNDKLLLVLMNQRFRQDSQIIKNYIKTGTLGDIYRIRMGWMTKWDRWNRPEWVRDKKISGGGVLLDHGIQLIDLLLWMLKYPKVVRVGGMIKKTTSGGGVEDTAIATFYLEKGIIVTLEVSWALIADTSEAWTVFAGTKGRAYMNPTRVHVLDNDKITNIYPLKALKPIDIHRASYESELRHFVEVIRKNTEPGSTAKECIQALRVVEAIYEAAKAGHELAVDIGPLY